MAATLNSTVEFGILFHSVCDHYGLSKEARAVAWLSALKINGSVRPHALRCYRILAATKPPYLPSQL